MTQDEYQRLRVELLQLAESIMNAKQPEYTMNNTDVLNNFKTTAEALKIAPIQVWAVFLHKHIQSILTHAQNEETIESEPIKTRYADAINYLLLGFALYMDKKREQKNLN